MLFRSSATAALPELLRSSLACLLFSTAFAGFARRPGSDFSLLEEVQMKTRRIRPQGSRGPQGSSRAAAADYLRDVARREEG